MFLVDGVLWLASAPFRLALWLVGLTVWTLTLPFRIVWGVLSFFGIGHLVTLAVIGGAGYALWRLVADDEAPAPAAPPVAPANVAVPGAPVAAPPATPAAAAP